MAIISSVFFYILAGILVISALMTVLARTIVYSALSLIVAFFAVAGLYILLNADFVGVSQILIYGVGIIILLIFAIMLTSQDSDKNWGIVRYPRTIVAFLVLFGLLFTLIFAITDKFSFNEKSFNIKKADAFTIQKIKKEGTAGIIGEGLLGKYVLPFELLSLLLLSAIVGSVVIAKKDTDDSLDSSDIDCLEEERG